MATGMGIGAILPLGFYDPLVSRQVIVRHSRHIEAKQPAASQPRHPVVTKPLPGESVETVSAEEVPKSLKNEEYESQCRSLQEAGC